MTRTCPYCGKELTFSKGEFEPKKIVCPRCGRKPYRLMAKQLTAIHFLGYLLALGLGILVSVLIEDWNALIRWLCGVISAGAIAWFNNVLVRWLTRDENIQQLVDREDDFLRKGENDETTGRADEQPTAPHYD